MKARKPPAPLFTINNKIEKHRAVMDQAFIKMRLKTLDDWLKVPISKLESTGAKKTLNDNHYDVKSLLQSVYPNYPWNFESNGVINVQFFKKKENQNEFMEKLFYKFNLQTLEDWKDCTQFSVIKNGGASLVNYHFKGDFGKLLTSLYPNYPWQLHPSFSNPRKYFSSIENKKTFFNEIFCKLELITLEDWIKVPFAKIRKYGGDCIISYYKENIKNLLSGIYPNYPWKYCELWEYLGPNWLKSMQKQREFMNYLFRKFDLQSIDDWVHIPALKLSQNGGEKLVIYYEKDMRKLLQTIYPKNNWKFDPINNLKPNRQLKTIDKRRIMMDRLYIRLNLKNLGDWCKITAYKFECIGGKNLLTYYYRGDMKKLLVGIYPNYPWDFDLLKTNYKFFLDIENQRNFMDNLFKRLNLNNFDDWLHNQYKNILNNGGEKLLIYYNDDFQKLFSTLYPNYPWNFYALKIETSRRYFKSKENQKIFMEKLFKKFNLKTPDDWLHISTCKIAKKGGESLLRYYYKGNFHNLLKSLYPNHHWQFDKKIIFSALLEKILSIMKQYSIRQKCDWYRVPLDVYQINLFRRLNEIFPDEKWKRKNFLLRAKRTHQRLLFSMIEQIYPPHLIIENYRHPHLLYNSEIPLEYDIFIPALNLALEYQGEQHFDDMPATFPGIELFLMRDQWKESFSEQLLVRLIYIPFWWDKSFSSLLSTLSNANFLQN